MKNGGCGARKREPRSCCVAERPASIIMVFESEANLNSKKSTAIRVGNVLEYQKCNHEKEQPAAEEQRSAGARDMASAAGDGTSEQIKSGRQAGDGGIEDRHVRKTVFVRITPVLDRGIRLQPQSASMMTATTAKIIRSFGDAVISAWSMRCPRWNDCAASLAERSP
jgi:hypothetical protein